MSSSPGKRPVADLSDALRFVQAISEVGFKAWQLLPIFDTAGRASPFAPDSLFALSPDLFSIEMALKDGLSNASASPT